MKRSGTPAFVLTLPLVVKPGEDRSLLGRMEAGRRLTNATLGEALRRHGLLKQSKSWQHARTILTRTEPQSGGRSSRRPNGTRLSAPKGPKSNAS
jgi:hypothetical protein